MEFDTLASSDGCSNPCDNIFTFCLSSPSSNNATSLGCTYGSFISGVIERDDITFTSSLSLGGNTSRLMLYNGTQWPFDVSYI